MRAIIIGTGFLGKVVVDSFHQNSADILHTYNLHKYFDDSRQFDLFSQSLNDVVALSDIDVVIVTSLVEHSANTQSIMQAMRRLFDCCKNKRVIYISTDAVFDGKRGFYSEIDQPTPATPYGSHKRLCENMLLGMVADHCIVRPSYIYGYSLGKLDDRLQKTIDLIRTEQPVSKFVNMFKSPVEVNQLAEIIEKLSFSAYRGILHVGGSRTSVYDFFKQALGVFGMSNYVLGDHLPEVRSPECLVDTSLNSNLARSLFRFYPMQIEDELIKSNRVSRLPRECQSHSIEYCT